MAGRQRSVCIRTQKQKSLFPVPINEDAFHQKPAWAVNGDWNIHLMEYTRAVYERLNAGQLKDGADGVREALHEMRKILENGDTFWNPGDY